MTPIYYSSTDASAPVLSGTVGSLITLLRHCLVTGYGSKDAAGWTEPFTAASNVAVFRQSTVRAEGCYLRVDDNGGGAGAARETRLRAYATMSDLSTGTEPCPTVEQNADGITWTKSTTADATARTWRALATDRWVYVCINLSNHWLTFFAGSYKPRCAPSIARFCLIGHQFGNATTSGHHTVRWSYRSLGSALSTPATLTSAHNSLGYVMRQAGAGVGPALFSAVQASAIGTLAPGQAGLTFPDLVSNGAMLSRVLLSDGINRVVGELPNLWAPAHVRPYASLADVTGPGGATLTAFVIPVQNAFFDNDAGRGQILLDRTAEDDYT